jgi:hypothetical protein
MIIRSMVYAGFLMNEIPSVFVNLDQGLSDLINRKASIRSQMSANPWREINAR